MAVYEGVVEWGFENNVFNTVLHYDDGGSGPPDFQGLTDYFWTQFDAAGMPGLVDDLTYEAMRWREDIEGGVGQRFVPTAGPRAGSAGASGTAGQLALLIRKLGATLQRPNKGRIYQPGVASSALTEDGLWAGSTANPLETMWETLLEINDGAGVVLDMVIKASKPEAANTIPYNRVAGLQVIGNPVTQRRRRLGTGI